MDFLKKFKQNKGEGKVLKNPKILEVNLIKEEATMEFDWKRNGRTLFFVLGVTIFIILEIYFGLSWWQQDEEVRLEGVRAEIETVNKQVAEMRLQAKDALAYQEKTKLINPLLDNHVYWTNFFSWLEKNTLSTVSYGSFGGDREGEYSLSGTAGSYAEVSWQAKQLLEAPFIKKVTIVSASSGEEVSREELEKQAAAESEGELNAEPTLPPGVSFNLEIEIDTEIFRK